jgi:hypothetical protein
VVEIEHPAETLAPLHRVGRAGDRSELQEPVCNTLAIACGVVVSKEMGDRALKRGLPKENHSVQTLGFYRAHKAFGEGIQVWRSRLRALRSSRGVRINVPESTRRVQLVSSASAVQE